MSISMAVDFISILKGILVLFMLKYITDCKERNNITYTRTEERMIKEKSFKKADISSSNGSINICDSIAFKHIRLFLWRIKTWLLIYDLLME